MPLMVAATPGSSWRSESFLGGERAVGDDFAAAADALHAEDARDLVCAASGRTCCSKLGKWRREQFSGICTVSKGKSSASILRWMLGFLWPVKPMKRTLPCFFGFERGFGGAVGSEDHFGIVVVDDFVDLPEIEMIGLQPAQRFFQLLHGDVFAAAVGADLGHEERLVALAL